MAVEREGERLEAASARGDRPRTREEGEENASKDFINGYSSERINPGDKKHSVENINKVVALETNKKNVLHKVRLVYNTISKNDY